MASEAVEFTRIAGKAKRFYRMFVQHAKQASLLPGDESLELVVVWGRIDRWKKRRVERFTSRAKLEERWTKLAAARRGHDYTETEHGAFADREANGGPTGARISGAEHAAAADGVR